MSADPRIEAAARALNVGGWTCQEGSDEPGNYDACADCKRYCDEHATAALAAADAASIVTTVEELDALPEGAVALGWAILGSTPYLRCRTAWGRLAWGCVGEEAIYESADLLKADTTARVLYRGQP